MTTQFDPWPLLREYASEYFDTGVEHGPWLYGDTRQDHGPYAWMKDSFSYYYHQLSIETARKLEREMFGYE